MDVVASSIHEHLGPVVPVDDDDHRFRQGHVVKLPPPPPTSAPAGGPVAHLLGKTDHKIIGLGSSDEHHILTTPGGMQRAAQYAQTHKRNPAKFSAIVNEYVGACFEDNCNIGESI